MDQHAPVSRRIDRRPGAHARLAARSARIGVMLALVGLLAVFLGYQVGRDLAHKANRADCAASGGPACVSTR